MSEVIGFINMMLLAIITIGISEILKGLREIVNAVKKISLKGDLENE